MNDVPVGETGHNLHASSPQEAEVLKSMPAKLRSSIGVNKNKTKPKISTDSDSTEIRRIST